MKRQDGAVAVFAMVLVIVTVVLAYGVARVGLAAVLRTRAEGAADAAALAAADRLALGGGEAEARADASAVASANGARLVVCDCRGNSAEVVVELTARVPVVGFPAIRARSRAEIGQLRSRNSRIAPALSRYSLKLPHLGDCTHDGQPSAHEHRSIRSSVARTWSVAASKASSAIPAPPG